MAAKKSILIAGGAGFLGSYLCDRYIDTGWVVICVDNLSTSNGINILHLKNESNFRFIHHDIVENLPKTILEKKYDVVVNLASPASPPQYQRLAIETLRAGSEGTLNLLELAHASNARFFHASTSEVYGDPDVHPQPESYWGNAHSYGPRSMYDESKRYAEALIYSYRKIHKLSTATARFFNTYGPRMDASDGRVVSNFIVQALQNQDLTIYGDGSQTRSFCYIDDLINGILAFIESNQEGPINLGNPVEFSIEELAKKVIAKTGSKSKVTYLPLPGDDPTQRKPDISLARDRLNWEPKVGLDEGLGKTVEYFRSVVAVSNKIKTPNAK